MCLNRCARCSLLHTPNDGSAVRPKILGKTSGSSVVVSERLDCLASPHQNCRMTPMKVMKATKAAKACVRSMTKSQIAKGLATGGELKTSVANNILDNLASIAQAEVKKTGKFIIPGVVMIKTRKKSATNAGKKMVFGKEVFMQARPGRTIVKAIPVPALKQSI